MDSTADGFAPTVLRGLAELAPSASSHPDLALELGLTAWMRQGEMDVEETRTAMKALRIAVVEAAEMDLRSEPVPLIGRSPKDDLVNWAIYLANLVQRAAASKRCHTSMIVEQSIRHLAA
jgi:hypothetical protein